MAKLFNFKPMKLFTKVFPEGVKVSESILSSLDDQNNEIYVVDLEHQISLRFMDSCIKIDGKNNPNDNHAYLSEMSPLGLSLLLKDYYNIDYNDISCLQI